LDVKFKKRVQTTEVRDPRQDYQVKTLTLETRWDPLTDRTVRILDLPIKKLTRLDVDHLLNKNKQVRCPFCPDMLEEGTPKFPDGFIKGGRLRFGEVCIVPNRLPFDKFCAVAVLTRKHWVPVAEFTEEILFNGFSTAQIFLRRVVEIDRTVQFCSVNWNYLPMSGGSVLHPHLQIIVGEFPTNYQREMILASQAYRKRRGKNFWDDLIATEKKLDERYIGAVGNTVWLAHYAPRGYADIMAVIGERYSIVDLSEQDLRDFVQGLLKVFRYFDDFNHYSFNMTLYSGAYDGDDSFWVNAGIVTRRCIPPMEASDVNYLEKLHGESIGYKRPERLCQELRGYF
jgi:hypothetical protein